MAPKTDPKTGEVYQHYKGGTYRILAVGMMEDSHKQIVVYQNIDPDIRYTEFHNPDKIWVKELALFTGVVDQSGKAVKRFKRVEKNNF